MLARSTELQHPSGVSIKTPILIPSFSSKGFRFNNVKESSNNRSQVSEVTDALKTTSEYLTESMLISAYDLYYNHIHIEAYPTEIVFVDSGGYETADAHDLSAVWRHTCPIKDWTLEFLQSELDRWPEHVPAAFVNYDHGILRRPIIEQIEDARKLFSRYPNQLHDFLLKPETMAQQYLNIGNVLANISKLKGFDIIGVTEKELGNSLLKRMCNIAKIRLALDEARINTPIHVFGSLDPLTSPMYFMAGAEIFDGLTWLRYSYYDGTAIYNYNYGAICVGIHERDNLVISRALIDNIYYLSSLRFQMKNFLHEQDFSEFNFHSNLLRNAFNTFRSELGGGV